MGLGNEEACHLLQRILASRPLLRRRIGVHSVNFVTVAAAALQIRLTILEFKVRLGRRTHFRHRLRLRFGQPQQLQLDHVHVVFRLESRELGCRETPAHEQGEAHGLNGENVHGPELRSVSGKACKVEALGCQRPVYMEEDNPENGILEVAEENHKLHCDDLGLDVPLMQQVRKDGGYSDDEGILLEQVPRKDQVLRLQVVGRHPARKQAADWRHREVLLRALGREGMDDLRADTLALPIRALA
mmetsp:Transcript_21480/g.73549  ORF Transcript_21480/g.73549 Transcript_21480/m.73549 type:complete len:244 (+) Transcript_21480:313-1044(+)